MSRIDRELETRERETRIRAYTPPQQLPDPIPQAGYSFRWVRTAMMGQSDARNVSMSRREGYEPVKVEDHPEMEMALDDSSKASGNVEIGGLMLCKIPTEILEGRQAYYERLTQQQINSVDNNFMRENDSRMPLFTEKRSEVSFNRR
jgi:hypothetical protein